MCITLIKLSINSSGEVQPKWTMPGRVKYVPNTLWTYTPYPTDSHLDKSNNYICVCYFRNQPTIVALENSVEL